MDIIDRITAPSDLKRLTEAELNILCGELREFLIENVSRTGGHLASNLGVVELTLALHLVFDSAFDRFIFDVGHQSYVHKILTGRKNAFSGLRKFGGLSGFPKPDESIHDASIAGHASTSISTALGIARARTLRKQDFSVISVIGDGALTGGLSYEGLSDAGASGEPLIIVLNDNGMSITSNVGGIAQHLSRQRIKPSYIAFKSAFRKVMTRLPGGRAIYRIIHALKSAIKETILHCSMFEEMGLQYIGPIDGHDIIRIKESLQWAKGLNMPVVVHIITQKGRGYRYAELSPEEYHGVKPFDYEIGLTNSNEKTFSDIFGEELIKLAEERTDICAITASMTMGTGLTGFSKRFPDRFFDVGIAEGHAVTTAAGMALFDMIPVFAVYSTFLQRSYDMLLHDVAISGLHIVIAVDRAGIVAGDGETHQGIFDVAYLRTVPGMTILSPASFAELRDMLRYAVCSVEGPVALRYPRGGEGEYKDGGFVNARCVRVGDDVTIVTYGVAVNTALQSAEELVKDDISVEVIKLGIIQPLDLSLVLESAKKTRHLIILEEVVGCGGLGEYISSKICTNRVDIECVILMNTGNRFLPSGEQEKLKSLCRLDEKSLSGAIREVMANE